MFCVHKINFGARILSVPTTLTKFEIIAQKKIPSIPRMGFSHLYASGLIELSPPPSASARPALVSSPTTTAPARRHTLVGKAASDAVRRSHPYNLRGSGHSSILTAAEVEVMDSAEVFSLYRPDWIGQSQSMTCEPICASDFLQAMAEAERVELVFAGGAELC